AETGLAPDALLVVNTSARTRSGVVEVTVPAGLDPGEGFVGADGIGRAVQLLGMGGREEAFVARVAGTKVGWVADRIVGSTFDGQPVGAWSVLDEDATIFSLLAAGPDDAPVDLHEAREALLALGRAGRPVTVRMEGAPRRRILVETGPVAGYGWATLRRAPAGGGRRPAAIPVRVGLIGLVDSRYARDPGEPFRPIARLVVDATSSGVDPAGRPVLDNGIVRVEVDPEGGTFSIAIRGGLRAEGLNRYEDGGDGGDTYTWCPPAVDTVVDRPASVAIEVEETGPLRGRVVVTAAYEWPTYADGDERACRARSAQTTTTTLRTAVSLVAGDSVVGVETVIDNRCRDHRLRVHFPLPAMVAGSDAGCAFAVVHRRLDVESGPSETPPPTFPARRFVDCSGPRPVPASASGAGTAGLAVIADGTFEYEVCNQGRELAVTLLRSTGWLSRRRLPLRPDPAGPAVAVDGAQVQGVRRRRYGLLLHAGDWESADLMATSGEFLDRLEAVTGSAVPGSAARAARPSAGQVLRVDGPEVSAVGRDSYGLFVR
ncbi:MAG TPA: glycoside hydrolase family 38 C-terminal domain-containing protein, partial [Acidimicrobiia bacterium]|nr:glycoside hydrolase family 38 C-terminal domain-containing protein [Acidimicrobiia bacterium]